MNRINRLLCTFALFSLVLTASAQTVERTVNLRDQIFEAPLASGATLRLHLHDGDFRVVGADTDVLTVQAEGKNLDQARKVKIQEVRDGENLELTLSHVPKNELQVTITIPRNTHLYARMRGGDLSVDGVVGNKDLALTGGDLTVGVGDPAQYAHVDLKVKFGDISGSQFGSPKGEIGNSVLSDGPGQYQLQAHVFAGDLTLKDEEPAPRRQLSL
ncbi:MAG TPA: hypothetical protein VEJ47_14260 [Candidatus Eremiobacteraceae bacterium]|nr:hypothetical protein [Candidatus Eremiobacteraceae bacterium]